MNFDEAFNFLTSAKIEGEYSNHAADPGGATRYGVTEDVARAHGYTGLMREMPLSFAQQVYKADYWDACKCDALPEELRYPVFDAAVNSGVRQSIRWMQRAAGTVDDGIIGPVTLSRLTDPKSIKSRMLGLRLSFLSNLPTWPVFSRGWSRRISAILEL